MKEFESNRTINGSYGEVWLDDDYIGEIESGKAEVDITYTDIQMARRIINGKKMTKAEGKGSIKLHHVRKKCQMQSRAEKPLVAKLSCVWPTQMPWARKEWSYMDANSARLH